MVVIEPRKKSALDWLLPLIGSLIILFLTLHLAVSYDVASESPVIRPVDTGQGVVDKEYFNSSVMFSDFAGRLSENPSEIIFTESTLKFLAFGFLLSFILWGYVIVSRKKYISGKEYGTSDWGNLAQVKYLFSVQCCKDAIKTINKSKLSASEKKSEIQKAKLKYENSDILLTKTEKLCLYHTDSLNCNTLIVAGSGAGKTTGYAIPNLLQASDNDYSPCYVVTDPKGEILQRTGYFLENVAKYKVKVLNLKDQKMSFRYNPFKYINIRNDAGELQNQVKKLVTSIMTYQVEADSAKGEEFWKDMAVLCAEGLFLATHYGFPMEERNMNTVMELFRMLQIDEDEEGFNCDLDHFFRAYDEKYASDYDALSASRKYWEFRKKCRGRTANSVLSTMQSKLNTFDNINIQHIFSDDDMELEKLGEERIAIFVVLPPMEKAFNFVANLFYVQMFDMLEYTATVKHEQKLPIPVRFILDEFYNTGKIPSFQNILSYARSFGISISVIIQSLDQLKEMYEKSWGVIVDNCSTFLYLGGVNHTDSLKYISEKLGKGTFDKRNSSRTRGRQSSSSTNEDRLGRELLALDEVAKIHNRKCILFVSGKNPFYSQKNFFKFHKNYKYTWDANKKKNVFTYNKSVLDVPHCEESESAVATKHEPPRVALREISAVFGQDAIVSFLNSRIVNTDFDDDEMYLVNDGEKEELDLYAELDKEENDVKNVMDSILSNVISMSTDSKSIIHSSLSLIKSEIIEPNSVDFDDYAVDDGEPTEVHDYDESVDDVKYADDVVLNLNDLEEDMSGFLEQLNIIDASSLQDSSDNASISA